ncbi:hypothetical protein [Caballeronia sp. 15711]|uniref:hypothetical protein n=1 Tax=Caballeronia sp. 15711 TaxID=3391029 RepID=UPI0039E351C3
MSEYFYQADSLAFQYQTLFTLRELRFRLNELQDASKASIAAFHKSLTSRTTVDDRPLNTLVRYRFSSAIGMTQTLKDVLETAIPRFSWVTFVADIPHAETLQSLRNAVTHDGQYAVTLWADGQWYLAVNVSRPGRGKKIHEILAPAEDVEKLALSFFEDVANRLHALIGNLQASGKLSGPVLPGEWFEAATRHPALKRFHSSCQRERTARTLRKLDRSMVACPC